MKILTLAEWGTLWSPISPDSTENITLTSNEYAKKCNNHKNSHPELTPAQWSNARYEVYIENLLVSGIDVPDEIITTIHHDANRYYDVPLVGARLMKNNEWVEA